MWPVHVNKLKIKPTWLYATWLLSMCNNQVPISIYPPSLLIMLQSLFTQSICPFSRPHLSYPKSFLFFSHTMLWVHSFIPISTLSSCFLQPATCLKAQRASRWEDEDGGDTRGMSAWFLHLPSTSSLIPPGEERWEWKKQGCEIGWIV